MSDINRSGDGVGDSSECKFDEQGGVDIHSTEFTQLERDLFWRLLHGDEVDYEDKADDVFVETLKLSDLAISAAPAVSSALEEMVLQATVEFVEQPASTVPFRSLGYVGWIRGAHSTPENKTYPTIRINNYQGDVMVAVYCANKDEPFSPHPHKLVDSEGCARRVVMVKMAVSAVVNWCQLRELGIQRGGRHDIQKELEQPMMKRLYQDRSALRTLSTKTTQLAPPWTLNQLERNLNRNLASKPIVTVVNSTTKMVVNSLLPQAVFVLDSKERVRSHLDKSRMKTGVKSLRNPERKYTVSYTVGLADDCDLSTDPKSIDLDAVRLVFQVYLHQEGQETDSPWIPLAPIVSDVIHDDKSLPEKRDVLTPYDLLNDFDSEF